ncbi:MAG: UDP-glucose 4-epimerase GalE [Bdellovibrionaceae bacterium]|nr:UDP-glucose 4-epimerase GalE [Pseudobdellovibrionaceae bacterium]MDW8189416.1 UDP-glucose 4-epimerase GalE [Pseudobdellovibrionaceae bacterium]
MNSEISVLVTGGAGYIGSHTVSQLCAHPKIARVIVLDDLSTGFREAVDSRAEFVQGSVLDSKILDYIFSRYQVSAVVHFAAKLVVPESVIEPVLYYENNVMGMIQLIKAMRRFGARYFIFSSTAAVYGNPPPHVTLIGENESPNPLNPYGWSKLMAEQILKDAVSAYGFAAVVLRYFNVAGATESNGQRTRHATHLIKVAAQAAVGKRSFVEIFGSDYPTKDGTGVRDYIHVEDLARAHILSLEYLLAGHGSSYEVFNCGYGYGHSVIEVLEAMKRVSGVNFEMRMSGRRPGDAACLVADPEKIRKTLGWRPQFQDLEGICRSAYLWEKKWSENGI